MKDSYGREIDYLRISVTDLCNMRCVYCMPEEGVEKLPHSCILSYDEICRIVSLMAPMGIKKVKITGGEPLVRKGITGLIRDIKNIPGIEQVTLTTNGTNLKRYLDELRDIGIDGINISMDSLRREGFVRASRTDLYDEAMEGLEAAIKSGLNVKINCVPILEDRDITDLAALARDEDVQVRYIEIMPVGQGKNFTLRPEEDIMKTLEEKFGRAVPAGAVKGNGPAHYVSFEGFRGNIGFISAISHKFCSSCDRLRLTADGHIKTCLQYESGVFLRDMLRDGTADEDIKKAVSRAVCEKPRCHEFGTEPDSLSPDSRLMSQIGG